MLYHCGLLFEIWTLIICMHRMHNEKVRIDFGQSIFLLFP